MLAPGVVWERRRRAREVGREAAWKEYQSRYRNQVVAGRVLSCRVVTAHEAYYRYFQPHFRLRRRYGLGFLVPRQRMGRLPAPVVRGMGRLESWLGRFRPFVFHCRFFVLELEPRKTLGA